MGIYAGTGAAAAGTYPGTIIVAYAAGGGGGGAYSTGVYTGDVVDTYTVAGVAGAVSIVLPFQHNRKLLLRCHYCATEVARLHSDGTDILIQYLHCYCHGRSEERRDNSKRVAIVTTLFRSAVTIARVEVNREVQIK